MGLDQELDTYLRARFTLILLVTPEEERALQVVKGVCERARRPCLTWDAGDGFQVLAGGMAPPSARDPISAMEQIERADGDAVFVLKDMHELWGNAQVKRKLRNAAQNIAATGMRHFIESITPDPAPPAPTVTVGG